MRGSSLLIIDITIEYDKCLATNSNQLSQWNKDYTWMNKKHIIYTVHPIGGVYINQEESTWHKIV